MDGELTKDPVLRWQKKLEASEASSSLNVTKSGLSAVYNPNLSGTSVATKTPCIPNRGSTNFELGHYLSKQDQEKSENDEENEGNSNANDDKPTRVKLEHRKLISESMQVADSKTTRILSYQNKAPPAPELHVNPLNVVYTTKTPLSTKSGSRYIPTTSERILDAPDIINNFYFTDNIVTVALGSCVYLWNAGTGSIQELVEYEEGDHACALSWIQDGQILAIGNKSGIVEFWDCDKVKRLRVMDGHSARVGSLAWNSYLVSSGSLDGSIVHHDVRSRDHKVATLNGHTQEVCGLKWSTDYKYLASGGNDILVNVWTAVNEGGVSTANEPLHVFNQHQAAVRALDWCPWQPNVLASGGGTADRCIKFWNVNNGSLLNSVDTKSQWLRTYKELISAHGFANNQLTKWKYPSMVKQAELTGHTSRVLQLALSPDASTVMSAGTDETLRLWNCFAPDPHTTKKSSSATKKPNQSAFRQSIR
uniref:CDC20/Fizzy WD40 domain-containing protein n=1 Tax=Glossina morsitans morsitans TaxID=37546 RepID=A0A1B0GEK7_GLOMM